MRSKVKMVGTDIHPGPGEYPWLTKGSVRRDPYLSRTVDKRGKYHHLDGLTVFT